MKPSPFLLPQSGQSGEKPTERRLTLVCPRPYGQAQRGSTELAGRVLLFYDGLLLWAERSPGVALFPVIARVPAS